MQQELFRVASFYKISRILSKSNDKDSSLERLTRVKEDLLTVGVPRITLPKSSEVKIGSIAKRRKKKQLSGLIQDSTVLPSGYMQGGATNETDSMKVSSSSVMEKSMGELPSEPSKKRGYAIEKLFQNPNTPLGHLKANQDQFRLFMERLGKKNYVKYPEHVQLNRSDFFDYYINLKKGESNENSMPNCFYDAERGPQVIKEISKESEASLVEEAQSPRKDKRQVEFTSILEFETKPGQLPANADRKRRMFKIEKMLQLDKKTPVLVQSVVEFTDQANFRHVLPVNTPSVTFDALPSKDDPSSHVREQTSVTPGNLSRDGYYESRPGIESVMVNQKLAKRLIGNRAEK